MPPPNKEDPEAEVLEPPNIPLEEVFAAVPKTEEDGVVADPKIDLF